MTSTGCTRRVIAAAEFAVVEQCSCGSVHLTIGAVTLRLASSAIPSLALALGDAARALVFCDAFSQTPSATDMVS